MSKQTSEIMELLLDHHLPSVQENSKISPSICKTNIRTRGGKKKKKIQTIKPELHTQFCPIRDIVCETHSMSPYCVSRTQYL